MSPGPDIPGSPSRPGPSLQPDTVVLHPDWSDRPHLSPERRSEPPSSRPTTTIEPLQGWHLPLLDDPSLVPLQPLLQRCLLLSLPRNLASALARRQSMGSRALVAWARDRLDRPRVQGLIVIRPLNRRSSCWEVQHLRLAMAVADGMPAMAKIGRAHV